MKPPQETLTRPGRVDLMHLRKKGSAAVKECTEKLLEIYGGETNTSNGEAVWRFQLKCRRSAPREGSQALDWCQSMATQKMMPSPMKNSQGFVRMKRLHQAQATRAAIKSIKETRPSNRPAGAVGSLFTGLMSLTQLGTDRIRSVSRSGRLSPPGRLGNPMLFSCTLRALTCTDSACTVSGNCVVRDSGLGTVLARHKQNSSKIWLRVCSPCTPLATAGERTCLVVSTQVCQSLLLSLDSCSGVNGIF